MKTVTLTTFGYKYGPPSLDPAVPAIDCRDLINPHSVRALREHTGLHPSVQDFVRSDINSAKKLSEILEAIEKADDGDVIMIGCHGGRHRSVAMAEWAKANRADLNIITNHTRI